MEKEANKVIRYARFNMCWFDHINPIVASMIAKVSQFAKRGGHGNTNK
jgi:hypothetical protein